MTATRPLIKHIRNHNALFFELAEIRNSFAKQLGLGRYDYHKTPKYLAQDGTRLCIEPERSIVLPEVRHFKGVKTTLTHTIPGLHLIPYSDIGFRYPTAALAGLDAPFIKRFRSEYFHKIGEGRDICRPTNLSYGIKSRGKGDNRQEYEVWIPDEQPEHLPLPLFIEKYAEDLPDDIRQFAALEPVVHGWMGVKRAAFEALYIPPKEYGDLVICLGFSVDVYNIGARPDLAYSAQINSSIALSNVELEWEVMGYYAPQQIAFDHDQVWRAINHTLEAVGAPISETYSKVIIATEESKTERILSTIEAQGITTQYIADLDLKPWEFLQTASEHRRKAHDPSRSVNLLGRLNRLFYQPQQKLPSLQAIHDLIAQSS